MMKAYISPVEYNCNANCIFCITRLRDDFKGQLHPDNIDRLISIVRPDKIEITGGGEPLLHSSINDVLKKSLAVPTQMYTNGELLSTCGVDANLLNRLYYLCISISHYNQTKNKKIMGVWPDIDWINCNIDIPIKVSLVLCKSGISSAQQLETYINSITERFDTNLSKIVVRQLFDFDYPVDFDEKIDINKVVNDFNELIGLTTFKDGNYFARYKNVDIEFETRKCACELSAPILRGDNNIYKGWSKELW